MTSFFTKSKSILLLVAILFVGSVGAQDLKNLKINQLSDQQMMQIWQQFSAKGITESEAIKMMVQKGLGPNEVGMFKKRLVGIQAAQKAKFGTSASNKSFIKDTSMFLQDSSWVNEVPFIRTNTRYYGYSFFSNPNTEFQPNFNIATPKNYILGPGDELNITLSGLNETDIYAKLNRDGFIKVEYVGLISLTGLTIEQAKQRIFARMDKSYPALTMGKTKLNVSLSNGRSVRVTVIGEVERPGAYQVSALASVFNVVYITGGPTVNGTLRNIQVIRNNKMIATIDLYPFLQNGLLPADIRLEDQDVLVFTPTLKRIELGGMVKRPMVYELLPNENLAQALSYAGGFSDSAFTDRLKIVQLNGREKLYKDVETSSFMNYIPMQSDSIFAEKKQPLFENKVTITGAVYRPGEYGFTPQLSLNSLLKKADGLRADAFLTRAIIKRVGVNREKTIVSVNLTTLNTNDITLSSEDSIQVFAKDDLVEQQFVTIDGNVRNPGKVLFRKGMQIQDLIALAGGFLNDAAYHRVELSRLEKNRTDAMSNQMVDLMKLELDAALTNKDASLTLEPQDYVYIPRLLNYKFIGDVKVRGEVLFPGNFALERRDETIKDIITRAGGLTQYGSLKDLQVFRNGTRIGVNLEQNAAKDMALLLLPGDSLFVSRNDPYVEIVGAVYNPQLIRFESSSFKSYISAAGGVKNRGSLSKAYIQYSNGINRKTTKFLFFKFYPSVKSGSKIIVPEVPEKQKGLSIAEITAITSIISGLVSLAAILKL
jgi:protein involved in polysaccharide export with SLBB domain